MCYNGSQRGMTGIYFQCVFVCDNMKNIGEMIDTKKGINCNL